MQVPETIQTASLRQNPASTRDAFPTIPTGKNQPAESSPDDAHSIPSDVVDPNRMIRPRRTTLPPLPDLRFEQSYLASLKGAETWGRVAWITIRDQVWSMLLSTGQIYTFLGHKSSHGPDKMTDRLAQVLLPLVQGTLWTLALSGWRYWNRNASLSGRTLGSRIRRWWYGVNNWQLPPRLTKDPRTAAQVEEVSEVALRSDT